MRLAAPYLYAAAICNDHQRQRSQLALPVGPAVHLERVQVPLDWTGQPAPTAQVEGSRVPETCLLMGAK